MLHVNNVKIVHIRGWCRSSREDGKAGLGRVVTDGTCPSLKRIHLSGLMLTDHLTDRWVELLQQCSVMGPECC